MAPYFGPSLILASRASTAFRSASWRTIPTSSQARSMPTRPTRWLSLSTLRHLPSAGGELRRSARLPDWARSRDARHHPPRRARTLCGLPGANAVGRDHGAQSLRRRGRGTRQHLEVNLRYAWPSADWGSLPIEGGIEAAYKRDLAASPESGEAPRRAGSEIQRGALPDSHRGGIRHQGDHRSSRHAAVAMRWVHQAYEIIPSSSASAPIPCARSTPPPRRWRLGFWAWSWASWRESGPWLDA